MLVILELLCQLIKVKSSFYYQGITDQMKIMNLSELLLMEGQYTKHSQYKTFLVLLNSKLY